jgi:hypothetical protein
MALASLLVQKQPAILERWLNLVFESYPSETSRFLKKEKDRFLNPIAYQLSRGLTGLYQVVAQDLGREEAVKHLDEVIRVRAVQDLSPAQGMAFIFLLKPVIRAALADELKDQQSFRELMDLEDKIDGLALLGFEVYLQRREKLFEIRLSEMKNRISGLLRRTGLDLEAPEQHDG